MDRLDLSHFSIGANFEDTIDVLCKKCGNLQSQCVCKKKAEIKDRDSYFLWVKEQKCKSKDITLCGVIYESSENIIKMLKEIKKALACGGSFKEDLGGYVLEFQGKHLEKLKAFLKKEKFKFKK